MSDEKRSRRRRQTAEDGSEPGTEASLQELIPPPAASGDGSEALFAELAMLRERREALVDALGAADSKLEAVMVERDSLRARLDAIASGNRIEVRADVAGEGEADRLRRALERIQREPGALPIGRYCAHVLAGGDPDVAKLVR